MRPDTASPLRIGFSGSSVCSLDFLLFADIERPSPPQSLESARCATGWQLRDKADMVEAAGDYDTTCEVAHENLWQRLRQLSVARKTAYGFERVSRVLQESEKICGHCEEQLFNQRAPPASHEREFLTLILQEASQIAREQSRKLNAAARSAAATTQ